MRRCFHDESSTCIGSLLFAPDTPNSMPETEIINIVDEERRNDNSEIQLSDDLNIQMVDI